MVFFAGKPREKSTAVLILLLSVLTVILFVGRLSNAFVVPSLSLPIRPSRQQQQRHLPASALFWQPLPRLMARRTSSLPCRTCRKPTHLSESRVDSAVSTVNNDTTINLESDSIYIPTATATNLTTTTSTMKDWIQDWIRHDVFLGMEPTPEILAIATIYFVEGALGLARLAQTYLLKDELSLGPAELSALSGIFVLPWTIKPLYGFLSDSFPLFGYKRKSYLIVAGLLGALSYVALGTGSGGGTGTAALTGTVGALMLSSACIAFSDVVADGIVVKRTREATDPTIAGGLQSLCWGASALGGLLSAYFSGSLLEIMSVRDVFSIAAVLPLLVALIAFQMEEKKVEKQTSDDDGEENSLLVGVQDQIYSLWEALKLPAIWRPASFLFLWQATPTADGAFFFFLTDDLHLGPEFMGRVRLLTSAAGLFGVWYYQKFLRNAKIKDILYWSTIASFPLGMIPLLLITHTNRALGIPDSYLIFGDDVALAALGSLSFMPTLVLAARICPPGVEAVLFATLMSIFNGASTVGTEIGALLTKWLGITDTNFDNLALLTILCNVSSLLPLLFMGLLDDAGDVSEDELELEDANDDTCGKSVE